MYIHIFYGKESSYLPYHQLSKIIYELILSFHNFRSEEQKTAENDDIIETVPPKKRRRKYRDFENNCDANSSL